MVLRISVTNKRWGNFPSVSAAWRVSQEKFFKVPVISELKLRFETGLTGNQGTGNGIYAPKYWRNDMGCWFSTGYIQIRDCNGKKQKQTILV